MKPSYATTLRFQRDQRADWHRYLSEKAKKVWRKRHFKQFLDEEVKNCEIRKNAQQQSESGS